MGPLKQRIHAMIEASGPLSLAQYMQMALSDPQHGYYKQRNAIGAKGDFITAPEISQMFGELLGLWVAIAWQAIGSPSSFLLVEAGPGRGTMMADALRAAASVPGFVGAAQIRLIENSPAMIALQRDKLSAHAERIRWIAGLDEVEEKPMVFIANEFLDALPFRQFIKAGGVWRERLVATGKNRDLGTVLGPSLAEPEILPGGHEAEPDGAVFEHAPAREAFVLQVSERLAATAGAALMIDYGHAKSGFGDTFQAVSKHAFTDPFKEPGMADLTSHVDFAAIRQSAIQTGVHAAPIVEQGAFLLAMGIAQRAQSLAAGKAPERQAQILRDVERLVLSGEMGALFKVLALCKNENASAMIHLPPFAAVNSANDPARNG